MAKARCCAGHYRKNTPLMQACGAISIVNSTGCGNDLAEFFVEIYHHGAAADFTIVIDLAGSLLRRR